VTAQQNAALSFNFYGTSVGIYGARRANHGRYQVTIDGQSFTPESAAAPDATNATLFLTSGLPKAEHTVRLVNLEGRFRDIDYVRLVLLLLHLGSRH
jgi:Carbohydrate esterase 2 N-terminal